MFYACAYVGMFVMLVGNNIFVEGLEKVKTSTDICRMQAYKESFEGVRMRVVGSRQRT
jgi:hypothetical protein